MKRFTLTLVLGCAATWMAFAGNDVPQAVKAKFTSMFPDVKKVEWGKESNLYEAEFEKNNVETAVMFDANGNYVETHVEIKVSELPASVATYVSQDYNGYKLKEGTKVTAANGTVTYEAEIKKGKKSIDLVFDSTGNFLKKEVEAPKRRRTKRIDQ